MRLLATTQSLEVVPAAACSLNLAASGVDFIAGDSSLWAAEATATASGTAVALAPAPAASTQRDPRFLSIYNAGASPVGLTVRKNSNGTLTTLWTGTLAAGQSLTWTEVLGWSLGSAAIVAGAYYAGLIGAEIAITAVTAATASRMHVVSGTAADYAITLPSAPAAGTVIGFRVKDWSVATKQYTLDAGGSVKIAGRTRYLVLVHTNVALFQYDGTDWQPLVLCLDTPWVTAGVSTIYATSVAPTKGTTTSDSVRWRRVGDSCEAHLSYRQSTAGTNGTGAYLFVLPFTVDTAKVGSYDASYQNAVIGSAGSGQEGVSQHAGVACMHNATTVVLIMASLGPLGSGYNAMGSAGQSYGYHVSFPAVNW